MYKVLCQNCALKMIMHLSKAKAYENSIFNKSILRLCSITPNKNLTEWNKVKSRYSSKQLTLILKTLNKCDIPDMKNKYAIEDSQIGVLESLQNEKRSYESLDDIVLSDVMKVSQLEGICTAIVTKKKKASKKIGIISPAINKENLENLKTTVGLRIAANHVSWCKVDLTGSNCNILKWDCESTIAMPLNSNHMEVIKTGISIAKAIPDADVYVMEREASKPMSKIHPSLVRLLLRQQQLISTIITFLVSRNSSTDLFNSFYMMRPFAPAQRFGLFLGNETVSATDVIQALLQQQNVGLKNISSVSLNDEILNHYDSIDVYKKEEMHKSLLLTITFFETVLEQT